MVDGGRLTLRNEPGAMTHHTLSDDCPPRHRSESSTPACYRKQLSLFPSSCFLYFLWLDLHLPVRLCSTMKKKTGQVQVPKKSKKNPVDAGDVYLSALMGGVGIGIALDKGFMSLSTTDSMFKKSLTMNTTSLLKLYVIAIGCSLLFTAGIAYFSYTRPFFVESKKRLRDPGLLTSVAGAIVTGVGMALAQGDLMLAAIYAGAGASSAWFVLAGAFFATIFFSVFGWKLLDSNRLHETLEKPFKQPFHIVASLIGCSLLAFGLIAEFISPYQSEFEMISNFPRLDSVFWLLYERSWSPIICGLLVGVMQAEHVTVAAEGLCVKNMFQALVSQISRTGMFEADDFPRLHAAKELNYRTLWPVVFGLSLFGGGMLSTRFSEVGVGGNAAASAGPAQAALGGFLLMAGAHMTQLSLCGHMLTGVSHLCGKSIMVTVVAWSTATALSVGW
jgi:hypothetical protein